MVRLEEQHDPTTRSTSFCCCCLLVVFSLSGSFRLLSAKLAVRLPGFFCGKDPPPGWTPRCCCYLVLFGSEVTGGEWVFPPCYQDLNKKYNVILCYFMGSVYSRYTINLIQHDTTISYLIAMPFTGGHTDVYCTASVPLPPPPITLKKCFGRLHINFINASRIGESRKTTYHINNFPSWVKPRRSALPSPGKTCAEEGKPMKCFKQQKWDEMGWFKQ